MLEFYSYFINLLCYFFHPSGILSGFEDQLSMGMHNYLDAIYFADQLSKEEYRSFGGDDSYRICKPSQHFDWPESVKQYRQHEFCEYCERMKKIERAIAEKDKQNQR